MLVAALEAEVADYVERHQQLVDEAGHRLVVRNGRAAERTLVTGAGALRIRAPRVHDRREGRRLSSYILPRTRVTIAHPSSAASTRITTKRALGQLLRQRSRPDWCGQIGRAHV